MRRLERRAVRQRALSATSSSPCTTGDWVVASNAMPPNPKRASSAYAAVVLALTNGGCWLTESLDDLPRWCVRQSPPHRFCADFDAVDRPEAGFSAYDMA